MRPPRGETAPAVWSIPVDFGAKPIQADRRFSRSGPGNTCPGWLTGHPLSDAGRSSVAAARHPDGRRQLGRRRAGRRPPHGRPAAHRRDRLRESRSAPRYARTAAPADARPAWPSGLTPPRKTAKRGRLVPNVRFWTRPVACATRPCALRHADERENQCRSRPRPAQAHREQPAVERPADRAGHGTHLNPPVHQSCRGLAFGPIHACCRARGTDGNLTRVDRKMLWSPAASSSQTACACAHRRQGASLRSAPAPRG